MSRRPSSYEYEERRNARIRQLREEGYETAFSTLKDWYWMLKLSYLF